jgi:hypothetical protein
VGGLGERRKRNMIDPNRTFVAILTHKAMDGVPVQIRRVFDAKHFSSDNLLQIAEYVTRVVATGGDGIEDERLLKLEVFELTTPVESYDYVESLRS